MMWGALRISSNKTSPRSDSAAVSSAMRHPALVMCVCLTVLLSLQVRVFLSSTPPRSITTNNMVISPPVYTSVNSVNNLRTTHHHQHDIVQKLATSATGASSALLSSTTSSSSIGGGGSSSGTSNQQTQCRFYLAESAIPQSGLGVFTAVGLHPGDAYISDICLYVADIRRPEQEWMHMRTHTWGRGSFFGQAEGQTSRAACQGMITTFNTMPRHMINTKIVSGYLPTNAGLHRATSPGAGAVTHHFGSHGVARDVVTAGSELTIDYGDWDFDPEKTYMKPERPVEWLREHGWCIDNIEVLPATDPSMGRGAFARYPLTAGQVVAPAPLQVFKDRSVFFNDLDGSEQLYVNYCVQPKNSKMIFFPYGQGVGLINHASSSNNNSNKQQPNVKLQWSANPANHAEWLELSLDDFWKVASPGGLLLEVVALRDIAQGEELFMDYGPDWEQAWQAHVNQWKPAPNAEKYIYPADMDETQPLRTVQEQQSNPYPENLLTMCVTPDWSDRSKTGRAIEWYDTRWDWWLMLAYCHILEREVGRNGDPVYTVSLVFHSDPNKLVFNPDKPREEMYIDTHVPRRAIRFVEKPYMDDEHLKGAFRHPIEFPSELVPDAWLTADEL